VPEVKFLRRFISSYFFGKYVLRDTRRNSREMDIRRTFRIARSKCGRTARNGEKLNTTMVENTAGFIICIAVRSPTAFVRCTFPRMEIHRRTCRAIFVGRIDLVSVIFHICDFIDLYHRPLARSRMSQRSSFPSADRLQERE